MMEDSFWMQEALQEAEKARQLGEVPVGAVVVKGAEVIGRGYNQPISSCNPLAHAEMLALQSAATTLGNYRLVDCELYVTLEPCTMCAGAIIHSRIKRLVYGATEQKAGAIVSASKVLEQPQMNHRVTACGGVLQAQCSAIIRDFFHHRRQQIRAQRTKPAQ